MKAWRKPRKPVTTTVQQVLAVLIIMLTFALALVMLGQAHAQAQEVKATIARSEEMRTSTQPHFLLTGHGLPWATVNAWDVLFREGPGKQYDVAQRWSVGTAVEVVQVLDNGWAMVLHHTHDTPMYVWAEYLDFAE